MQCLLEAGANVRHRNELGWDAMWLAANDGHTEIVGLLLEHGASSHKRDKEGITPLMAAAQAGQMATATTLLENELNVQIGQRAKQQRAEAEGTQVRL